MKVVYDPKKGKPKKRIAYLTAEFIRKWQEKNIQLGLTFTGSAIKTK